MKAFAKQMGLGHSERDLHHPSRLNRNRPQALPRPGEVLELCFQHGGAGWHGPRAPTDQRTE